MVRIAIVLLVAQIAAGTSHFSPLERLQAKVQVVAINELDRRRLAGEYSHPAKEFHGGLSGDDLYLFPDGTYISCEWADIEPLTVRDKGMWSLTDGLVKLTSSGDVTWDPQVDRKYVAVHRKSKPHEVLLAWNRSGSLIFRGERLRRKLKTNCLLLLRRGQEGLVT